MKPSDKMEESNLSKINLPVVLKIKELEETINHQIDGVLFKNGDLADENADNLKIKAEKTENISISFDDSQINYRVPLRVLIKKEIASAQVDAKGEIALSLSTKFKIEKNWKLTTHTQVVGYKWLQKPYLQVGLFKLPIKFIANTILKKSKSLLCTTLDEEIAKNFDHQQYIREAWKVLQSPFLASEEYSIWIILSPAKAGMTPLVSDGEFINSTIMLQTFAKAIIGEKPTIKRQIPLPPFQSLENINESFYLNLETEILYSEAEKNARKFMLGKSFSLGIGKTKVEDLKLSGNVDQFLVEVKLSGIFNGDISVVGKPVLDTKKNEIEIGGLEYKLKTPNILIRFFNWLFHRRIKIFLKKHTRVQLTEKINQLINLAEKELENYEITENVFLNGNLNKLKIKNIQLYQQALKVTITSSGMLNLFIKKIELAKETEN